MHEHLVWSLEAGGVEHAGPEEAVEANDILADEVVELDTRTLAAASRRPVVLEVLAVLAAPVLKGRDVAYRRIDPDVEELAGMAGNLEAEVRRVARDAPAAQRLLEPLQQLVRHIARRVARYPLLKIVVLRLKLEVEVFGILHDWCRAAGGALGRAELLRAVRRTAAVAAVAILVLGAALGACALNEAIRQEHLAVFAVELGRGLAGNRARSLHSRVYPLRKRLVLRRVRSIVVVELHLEIGEIAHVLGMAAGDKLLGCYALLARAYHYGRAVGVVGADIYALVAPQLLEPHPEIGLYVLHQMAKVYVTVGVRQSARYNNLPFVSHSAP